MTPERLAEIRALFEDTFPARGGHPPIPAWGKFDRIIVGELLEEIDRLRERETALLKLLQEVRP